MSTNTLKHPCFHAPAKKKYGRIHLPVAPRCNIQCNFCNRKYDCANESRPGVTTGILSPRQALEYTKKVMDKKGDGISVVGIAGPGDPFANPEETLETMTLIKREFPEIMLCVSSNGLEIAPYLQELKALETDHVTLTINGIKPEHIEDVYAWVRFRGRLRPGRAGVELLLERQWEALRQLREMNFTVKVNSIVIPGMNEHIIPEISEKISALGVAMHNCIPLIAAPGARFENREEPSKDMMKQLKTEVEKHLPAMGHCSRCRADAVGLLGKDDKEMMELMKNEPESPTTPDYDLSKPYVAVASEEGLLINQHLGEVTTLHICAPVENGGYKFVEVREAPPKGSEDRWEALAEILSDCRAVLVSGVGPKPMGILKEMRIIPLEVSGLIEDGLNMVYKNEDPASMRVPGKSNSECSGGGGGCG